MQRHCSSEHKSSCFEACRVREYEESYLTLVVSMCAVLGSTSCQKLRASVNCRVVSVHLLSYNSTQASVGHLAENSSEMKLRNPKLRCACTIGLVQIRMTILAN